MLQMKKCTEQDAKLAAAIERKRQLEEQRKARIFNPRIRKIGVDKEYLDKQVEEKRRQQESERERECRMDEAMVRSSKLAILLERQNEEERRKLNKQIDEFRQCEQKPEMRRDYDLYDPEALKKTPCIEDDKLGPASAQKFEGEDESSAERLKEQRQQMQSWIRQQMQERRRAELQHREAERAYQQALLNRDKRAMALERMEEECKRRLSEANASFNRALAEEQEQQRRCRAMRDDEDARAEIYNHVSGDFLTEAPEQAESLRGPGRPLANRYKGMSSAELKRYRDEQQRQIEQIQRMRAEEDRRNEDWNRLMDGNARAAESYQRELDRKRAELNKQIAEENLQLAQRHKEQQEYLNRHVYKQKPSPEFYEQFNKSTR